MTDGNEGMVKTIEWVNGKARILNQSLLPGEVKYIDCEDYLSVAEIIRTLKIRGAPAIGIATAMAVALGGKKIKASDSSNFIKQLENIYAALLSTRPTAVNIKWSINRIKKMLSKHMDSSVEELKELLVQEAETILQEDIEINKAIGQWGAAFIRDGDTVITHCNAGSLATGGYGTATAPIRVAIEQGKKIHVIVDETRPVLQGARLTAWELMQDKIPITLISDSAAGTLIKRGEVDLAIVGTDRTTRNGDVANKIGTYPLSVLCRTHDIPFFVAAPLSSVDFSLNSGELIDIEERSGEEITHLRGVSVAPSGVNVKNIAFDVTPAKFVTAIFTEKGAFAPRDLKKLTMHNLNLDEYRILSLQQLRRTK